MLEVVPETLSVTHFYYIAYQGSNRKKSNATLHIKGVNSTLRIFITRRLNRLPVFFTKTPTRDLNSHNKDGQLVWVEWLTVSTRSERTFLWLYHVMKESSKVATVFISCLCLMKVPEMNDNSLPAVYIKKNVRSSTRNSVCNSFLLYCLSRIQS